MARLKPSTQAQTLPEDALEIGDVTYRGDERPLRICQTHFAFYPTTGGVESHLLDLSAELVEAGHTVFALVGSLPDAPATEEISGIQVVREDLFNPERMRERKRQAGYAEDALWPRLKDEIKAYYRTFVRKHHIDVVHAHNFHHFLPEYGYALSELHVEDGLTTFLTVHEIWDEFLCEDLLENTQWNSLITVSNHVYRNILRQAPTLRRQPIRLIYHGIDVNLFSPENSNSKWADALGLQERPVIIHPARMLPWKGVIYTVQAMPQVLERFPNAVLIITDTNEIVDWIDELKGYREEVLGTIARLGLQNNVITQSFPYVELPWVYNYSDVVVYPTVGEEPFGLVPVEAMACAKPVIVSHSGGLVESVVHGKTGYVIEKRDTEAVARHIVELLANPEQARQLGRQGRDHAARLFSRQRMVRDLVTAYRLERWWAWRQTRLREQKRETAEKTATTVAVN